MKIGDNISELRRLESQATPGPWSVQYGYNLLAVDPRGGFRCPLTNSGMDYNERGANYALIAAMRNALPALLDEIERLRNRVAEMAALVSGPKQ